MPNATGQRICLGLSAPGWSEEKAIDDPTWLELGPYETVRLDG